MPKSTAELRADFFDWLYLDKEAYVCIAHADAVNPRKTFQQRFFAWPSERAEVLRFVISKGKNRNVWFGVNMLRTQERTKENCIADDLVWADLDTANPKILDPQPNVVILSSPGHYQAIWRVDQVIPPDIAEDYSKRIAYKYRQDGADPTGWDLTQLLRVPYTNNLKYADKPEIQLLPIGTKKYASLEVLESLDEAPISEVDLAAEKGMPEIEDLPSPEEIFYKYQPYLDKSYIELATIDAEESRDWSARLWRLHNLGFEAGMDPEEVFAIAIDAPCNKYKRDGRPIRFLWREVLKAFELQSRMNVLSNNVEPLQIPKIWNEEDYEETFIDRYTAWATIATDAVPAFHDLSGAILLSATLASHLTFEADYGRIVPNLWGMILGASTIDRKTTAMEMAKSILWEVDQDALLATDGTAEGLLQGLSLRANRTSMFHRDEVSGFFKSIHRKEYLSGMTETLTDLYDAKGVYRRMLRKEVIEIRNPIFLFFAGGIKEEVFANLSEDHVLSGFLPRFLVVIGEQSIANIRPTTAKTEIGTETKSKLIDELTKIKASYVPDGMAGTITIGGQVINLADVEDPKTTSATITSDALERYQQIETTMVEAAFGNFYQSLALPTFERLSRSLLKLAILIAASRQEPRNESITVERRDINNASRYVQTWGKDSIELMLGAGRTSSIRMVEKVRRLIDAHPGILTAELLRTTHMSSHDLTEVLRTLDDRGEIRFEKKGRGRAWWVIT